MPFYCFAEYDFNAIDTVLSVFAGGSIVLNPYVAIQAFQDGLAEEQEGFVIYLDILESDLDPRDVGQVNVSRSLYFVRINQSGTGIAILDPNLMCFVTGNSVIKYCTFPP